MSDRVASPHRRALTVNTSRFVQVLALLVFQLLLRAIAFAPLLYAIFTGRFLNHPAQHAAAISFLYCLPLYALVVMPFRFQAAARMASLHGLNRDSRVSLGNYLKWLAAALVRLARALPFVLPFLAFCVAFYYYMQVPGFNDSLLFIQSAGQLVGGDYPAGIIIIALVGLVTALLAFFFWRHDLAFEQQDVLTQGIAQALGRARDLRKRRRQRVLKTHRINTLLTLPAIIGVIAVIVLYLLSLPRMGMLAFDFLNMTSTLLTMNFPTSTQLALLVVMLVLWLPLLPLRKLAINAVLIEQ